MPWLFLAFVSLVSRIHGGSKFQGWSFVSCSSWWVSSRDKHFQWSVHWTIIPNLIVSVTTYKTGNVHMFSLLHRSRPIHPVQSEQASGWWCRVGDNLYLCKGIWIYAQIEEGANLWHVILGCWGSKYYQGDGWLGMFLLFHTLIMWLTDNWYRVSSSTGIHKAEWNWHRTSYNCAL